MRYLVTGAGGMLGHDLVRALDGREVTAATRADLDVSDAAAVDAAVAGHDVVINAAAYTKVDDAETHEGDAFRINATGAQNLAVAARRNGARIVQVSTDYVFRGDREGAWPEDAPLDPISAYGRTKAAGEWAVRAGHPEGALVVRAAWLYGADGPNFATTMLKLAATRESVNVVTDQSGPADLDGGPGASDRRAARRGCACRRVPRHERRLGELVRLRWGRVRGRRTRRRQGRPDRQLGLPAARAPTGQLRART